MESKRRTAGAIDYTCATRRGAVGGLVATGMSEIAAEHWCAAWEREAARHGIQAKGRYFWDSGRGWIDAQRLHPLAR